MRRSSISNTDKVIDSRDVIERIAELRADADATIEAAKTARERIKELDGDGMAELPEDDQEERDNLSNSLWTAEDETELTDSMDMDDYTELLALEKLAVEGEATTSEWADGAGLIHEDHFQDYAEELAEDIGAIDKNAKWPLSHIDWEAAADELKQDYSTLDFDGETYYVRDC